MFGFSIPKNKSVSRKVLLTLIVLNLVACNTSSENSASAKLTSYRVGKTPLSDPQNIYPYLQDKDGVCINTTADTCEGSGGRIVTQLKVGPGFIGFPFSLGSADEVQISLSSQTLSSVSTYSGPTATYSAKHYPVAVEHGRFTYFVFSGPALLDNSKVVLSTDGSGKTSTGDMFKRPGDKKSNALGIYFARFNHITGKVSVPLLIHVKHTDDPHDNAVLNFDSKGDLFILISGRSLSRSALLYVIEQPNKSLIFSSENLTIKNISPENIDYSKLTEQKISVPDFGAITYPKLLRSREGFRLIYSIYCTKGLNSSCDNTRQLWTAKLSYDPAISSQAILDSPKALAAIDGHYALATTSNDGQDIVVAFNLLMRPSAADRTNIYFLYSNDGGNTWRYIDSRTGDRKPAEELLPINSKAKLNRLAAVTFHSYGKKVINRVYLKDISINGDGDQLVPLISFVHSVGDDSHTPTLSNIHKLKSVTFNNGQWTTLDISDEVDHNYSTGFIHKLSNNNWRIYFPATPKNSNNALAGGAPAYVDLNNSGEVNYLSGVKATNESEYLNNLCEINYLRPVMYQKFSGFIGLGSASNPYKFESDSSNKHIPASPLYIIDSSAQLYRLPMNFDNIDENRELPLEAIDRNGLLVCDSGAQ